MASSAAAYRRRFVAMEGYEELTPAQIADKAWQAALQDEEREARMKIEGEERMRRRRREDEEW